MLDVTFKNSKESLYPLYTNPEHKLSPTQDQLREIRKKAEESVQNLYEEDSDEKYTAPPKETAERFHDVAVRCIAVIKKALQNTENTVILVSHGDLCNIAHMYDKLDGHPENEP